MDFTPFQVRGWSFSSLGLSGVSFCYNDFPKQYWGVKTGKYAVCDSPELRLVLKTVLENTPRLVKTPSGCVHVCLVVSSFITPIHTVSVRVCTTVNFDSWTRCSRFVPWASRRRKFEPSPVTESNPYAQLPITTEIKQLLNRSQISSHVGTQPVRRTPAIVILIY